MFLQNTIFSSYLFVTVYCLALPLILLILKIVLYRSWRAHEHTIHGDFLDMRRLKRIPLLLSDNDFICAYKIEDMVGTGVGFVRKSPGGGNYYPSDGYELHISRRNARSVRDNNGFNIVTLTAVYLSDAVVLLVISELMVMFVRSDHQLMNILGIVCFVFMIICSLSVIINFILYNCCWGRLYKYLYMKVSEACVMNHLETVSHSSEIRYEKVTKLCGTQKKGR